MAKKVGRLQIESVEENMKEEKEVVPGPCSSGEALAKHSITTKSLCSNIIQKQNEKNIYIYSGKERDTRIGVLPK